jgi:hypothetical protein
MSLFLSLFVPCSLPDAFPVWWRRFWSPNTSGPAPSLAFESEEALEMPESTLLVSLITGTALETGSRKSAHTAIDLSDQRQIID